MTAMYSFFKSRTVWTLIATMAVVDGNMLLPLLPQSVEATAVVLLGLLASYFHVNPSQQYNTPVEQG